MGMNVRGAPLFAIEPVAWDAPSPEEFDGLLVGSANAFRHAGPQLDAYTRLPVHAVGEATAVAARNAGFLVGQTGRGGLQGLLDTLDGRALRLLRLAGEDRVPLHAPDSVTVETRVVYRAEPQGLTSEDAEALRSGGVVALHSGAAARRFAEEAEREGLDRSRIDLALIGPRVEPMAGTGWRSIHTADTPSDTDLLALARALCQT
ncbi:uroporphyrinogen-III synthase [Qipengyuania flava]|nr:uroporphyrinogen-III synthase [Qipengyuania flava]